MVVFFLTGINWFSDLSVDFQLLPVDSQNVYCCSMSFHEPHFNIYQDFKGLENEIIKFHDMQVLKDPFKP